MDDCHIIGSQRRLRHTHMLLPLQSICFNYEALTTRDNKGETPLDIARRSGACAEIIGLLSLTPEEARSLGFKGMLRLYAPVAYWWDEMALWIHSRSYADCHKFINEHDDELVREVLKYRNSSLFQQIACFSQVYSDSLVFLALRMIHRHPLSLMAKDSLRTPMISRPSSMLAHPNTRRATKSETSSASPPPTSPPPPSPPSSDNTSPYSSSTRQSSALTTQLARSSSS